MYNKNQVNIKFKYTFAFTFKLKFRFKFEFNPSATAQQCFHNKTIPLSLPKPSLVVPCKTYVPSSRPVDAR